MLGYWEKPEETTAAIDSDGWLRTGDAGYIDDEDYLFLHDRIKDMIVSRWRERLPRRNRERASLPSRGVGRRGDRGPRRSMGRDGEGDRRGRGDTMVRPADRDVLAADIIEHCRGQLAHYKCPTSVDFADDTAQESLGQDLETRATGALLARPRTSHPLIRTSQLLRARLNVFENVGSTTVSWSASSSAGLADACRRGTSCST